MTSREVRAEQQRLARIIWSRDRIRELESGIAALRHFYEVLGLRPRTIRRRLRPLERTLTRERKRAS